MGKKSKQIGWYWMSKWYKAVLPCSKACYGMESPKVVPKVATPLHEAAPAVQYHRRGRFHG